MRAEARTNQREATYDPNPLFFWAMTSYFLCGGVIKAGRNVREKERESSTGVWLQRNKCSCCSRCCSIYPSPSCLNLFAAHLRSFTGPRRPLLLTEYDLRRGWAKVVDIGATLRRRRPFQRRLRLGELPTQQHSRPARHDAAVVGRHIA